MARYQQPDAEDETWAMKRRTKSTDTKTKADHDPNTQINEATGHYTSNETIDTTTTLVLQDGAVAIMLLAQQQLGRVC